MKTNTLSVDTKAALQLQIEVLEKKYKMLEIQPRATSKNLQNLKVLEKWILRLLIKVNLLLLNWISPM